ncbi:MAG: hypothetical protein B7Z55_06190, partial [Planctomycetales bacterium 12-60-4]
PTEAADRYVAAEQTELVLMDDFDHLPQLEQERCLALGAYLMLSTSRSAEEAAALEAEARERLQSAYEAGVRDAAVESALARLSWRRDPVKTLAFAQAALEHSTISPEARITAWFTLATTLMDAGKTAQARPILQQLTRARRYSEDWYLLSRCEAADRHWDAAIQAARRAAEISPQYPQLQDHLAQLAIAAGQPELAEKHRAAAEDLQRLLLRTDNLSPSSAD